jgi:hypothetical protein
VPGGGKLLQVPDHVAVLPSHPGGSVCGQGLSGNPFAIVGDMPARAVDQKRIAAVNRRDKVGAAA